MFALPLPFDPFVELFTTLGLAPASTVLVLALTPLMPAAAVCSRRASRQPCKSAWSALFGRAVSSASMVDRHKGHVLCVRNHRVRHSLWCKWPHGIEVASFSTSIRQTEHCVGERVGKGGVRPGASRALGAPLSRTAGM